MALMNKAMVLAVALLDNELINNIELVFDQRSVIADYKYEYFSVFLIWDNYEYEYFGRFIFKTEYDYEYIVYYYSTTLKMLT